MGRIHRDTAKAIAAIAKITDIKYKYVYKWLRKNGYIKSNGMPTPKALENDLVSSPAFN